MKYQGPEGTTGASVGGEQFNADENGVIEVPDSGDYAALLAPHGFKPIQPEKSAAPAGEGQGEGDKKPSDGLTAAQLKDALTANGIEFAGNASKADLAALLDAAPAGEGQGEGEGDSQAGAQG